MRAALEELPPPVTLFYFNKPRGKTSSESIYLFDQEAAKAGIVYYAEYKARASRWFAFHIWVAEADKEKTQQIIARLNPKYKPKRTADFSGQWSEIEPTRLSKTHQDHPWVFGVYREFGSDRDDGLPYLAFLFRNQERTAFGIKEWLGQESYVHFDVLKKMAHRVVVDSEFRRSLISDDPDLPVLWKKH